MTRRTIIIAVALVAGLVGWYAFRPDRAFLDRHVQEPAPAGSTAGAEVVLQGAFHSNAHDTRGTATVLRLADGRRVLRFTQFATSDGPDVQIYLVKAADVNDERDAAAGFINLGPLKGNVGDQNYDIPADVDLASYRAVSVWCRRFAVNFGAVPLAPPQSQVGA